MSDQELQIATDPRNVIIGQIGGFEYADYPDFSNAFVLQAYNRELDRDLTDEELDYFDENNYEVTQEYARLLAVGG